MTRRLSPQERAALNALAVVPDGTWIAFAPAAVPDGPLGDPITAADVRGALLNGSCPLEPADIIRATSAWQGLSQWALKPAAGGVS
jgi:hypothetical protein